MPDAASGVLLALETSPPAPQATLLQNVVLMVAIVAIMYFVIYMPQARERKAHEQLVAALAKDDRVITASGIHGRVVEVGEGTVVLEIAEKTRVTFDKVAIVRKVATAEKK